MTTPSEDQSPTSASLPLSFSDSLLLLLSIIFVVTPPPHPLYSPPQEIWLLFFFFHFPSFVCIIVVLNRFSRDEANTLTR